MLTQADEARTETEKAGAKEKVELEVVGSYDNNGIFQMKTLKENLKSNLGISEEEIEENEDGSITFELDGNKVTVDEKGKVEVGEKVPVIVATSINAEDLTIESGIKTKQLTVTTNPSKITEKLIYTSKEEGIVTVDSEGKVTARGEGTAEVEIKGEKSGTKTTCNVTVEFGVGVKVRGNNKSYTNNGTAVIPVGFCIVPGCNNVAEGLVISDNDEDTEADGDNIKANGNQFVWIPVNGNYEPTKTYVDTNVSAHTDNDTNYLPEGIDVGEPTEEKRIEDLTFEKEKELVTKEGIKGFYIARYEAGKESANTLVSKKGANVWVDIPQDTAKGTAKTFINNANVKSALCTGIQWDMVMAFVNGKNDGDGNLYLVEEPSSFRHKDANVGVQQAGANFADKVCNIYDLEGNCREYVAEKNTFSTENPYVIRGGLYLRVSGNQASARYNLNGDANSSFSFRFVLYVM